MKCVMFKSKNRIIRVLPFIVTIVMVIVMAVATIVEKTHGTTFVAGHIYSSWWFTAIWGVLAVASIARIIASGMHRQLTVLLLHASFLMILLGALVTHITSTRGYLHLRNGEVARLYTQVQGDGSMQTVILPFAVELDSFDIQNYEGTTTHSDYSSHLIFKVGADSIRETVSMNNIAVVEGYRFYQTSFDQDMKGSVLTVTYDPFGTGFTYVGYGMLMISAVLLLALRTTRLRQLYGRLVDTRLMMLTALLMIAAAGAAHTPVVARDDADRAGRRLIVYNGRVCPLNTLAHDFCVKVTGKGSYKGLSAEQLLLSLPIAPEEWADKELVKVKNGGLRERLGITTDLARVKDFYDTDGRYKLDALLSEESAKEADAQDRKLIRAIYDVDEQVSLVNSAVTGKLIVNYAGKNPPDECRISAEIFYNRQPFTLVGFIACFVWAVVVLLSETFGSKKNGNYGTIIRMGGLTVLSVLQLGVFLLRWYISGNIPLSNGFETMAFVSLTTLILTTITVWMLRRQKFVGNTLAVGGLIIAGLTLLVAHLSEMSPQITSLMPVLQSPWLTTHVSFIMVSYSLFAFTAVISVVNLVREDMRLDALNRLILYPAEMCLAVGIFLGAIWANQSWGTYWSWDPKEVWALISMLVYCIPLHTDSLPVMRRPKVLSVYLIFAFLSILMTYFGVNYLLGGMHSYANG